MLLQKDCAYRKHHRRRVADINDIQVALPWPDTYKGL